MNGLSVGFAGPREVQGYVIFICPVIQGMRNELAPVVDLYPFRRSAQCFQMSHLEPQDVHLLGTDIGALGMLSPLGRCSIA